MKTLLWAAFCAASTIMNAADENPLTLSQVVPLPGVKGRFDHFSIDLKGQRLFVAALGNNTLEVIDLPNARRLRTITGLHKPTGVLFLSNANQIAVANGDDGTFRIFSGDTYAPVATIKSLDDADNVRFDATANRIYVGYGDGALAAVDPSTWKVISSTKLPGHPESFQLAMDGPDIWVNVPDAKQVAIIDRAKGTVTATWPMTKFQGNFPMAVDNANHRLFVGCRKPARLVVFDTAVGKPVADAAISGDTDDLFYDKVVQRIYVSCGEGFIDVIAQRSADRYERTEQIPTSPGARTSFFSPDRREFYLAVPTHGSKPAELRIYKAPSQ